MLRGSPGANEQPGEPRESYTAAAGLRGGGATSERDCAR
jgi:hypothetical protein